MNEEPYNKREIDYFMKEIKEKLEEIGSDVKETKVQTIRTNGRVGVLEEWSEDARVVIENNTENINALTNFRYWIIGTGASFLILGGTIASLIYYNIDRKISAGIDSAFNERFSKIEVIK